MKSGAILAAILGALVSLSPAAANSIVKVQGGRIAGTVQRGVNVFLGVPYAQPPVGNLRWREPQPVKAWDGVRSTTRFSPSCEQADNKPFGPYTAAFLSSDKRSEDCLYLNVWAPSRTGTKRPVYVFVHGGAFNSGGADIAAYNGTNLARKGAVVVTINYRLGVFGFFAHPDLTRESPYRTSGNYGILDVIAALRWLRENAASFGGDASNITVAGQSAGAGIVAALLVSPLAKGLFDRAVLESGPVLGFPVFPLAAAEAGGAASVASAKVDGIAGLRALPATEVMKKAQGLPLPILDGQIIPVDPEKPSSAMFSVVPVIIGYNRDETPASQAPQTVAAFEQDVKNRFGPLTARVLALYPHANDIQAIRSGQQLIRDRRIAGLILWAERRRSQGAPIYAYSYEHVFPGIDPALFGAFHTSEVPYIFGALNLAGAAFNARDRSVSAAVQKHWIAFMKTGDPGVRNAPWPQVSLNPSTVHRIDAADQLPLLDAERLSLFRDFQAQGGKLGLL